MPLKFAPTLAYKGVEELRFAPGFFDATSPDHWSYAFALRLEAGSTIDLGADLVPYFRGLLTAVDRGRGRIDASKVTASATLASPDVYAVRAHVFDAFGDARPVDLEGTARHTRCPSGDLWAITFAPATSPRRVELDALAQRARCDQQVVTPTRE